MARPNVSGTRYAVPKMTDASCWPDGPGSGSVSKPHEAAGVFGARSHKAGGPADRAVAHPPERHCIAPTRALTLERETLRSNVYSAFGFRNTADNGPFVYSAFVSAKRSSGSGANCTTMSGRGVSVAPAASPQSSHAMASASTQPTRAAARAKPF